MEFQINLKNILIINYFFGDNRVPTARMVSDVCEEFKKKNIKFNIFYSSQKYKNLNSKSIKKKNEVRSLSFSNLKVINYIIFLLSLIFYIYKNNYKKYLILTDPPLIIIISPIIKFLKPKSEIIYWTMDLYPEALYASKIFPFRNKIIFNYLKKIKNYSLKFVDKMINLGISQNKLFQNYPSTKKILIKIVHPWDLRNLKNDNKSINKFLKKYNFLNKKIILYAGNIGAAHSIKTLINFINFCKKKNLNYYFIFACTGKKKKKLIKNLKYNKNVLITDYFSSKESSLLLNSASYHLVTLENEWSGIVYPSKLFGIIKTNKPVIYIGPIKSDIANLIKFKKYGLVFKNNQKSSIISKKIENFSNSNNLKRMNNYFKNPKQITQFVLS